jgi:hypothetical protein
MYIGKIPTVGNFQVCDTITVVDAQAAYTMQVDTVDVSPESANHMIVSLNGVIQKPTDAYTVSGSTITFASNLVTGDVINFIQILGNVLDLGVPSDNTVTTAKLSDSSVSLAKLTATGTKDATTFLRGDNTFAAPSGGKVLQVVNTNFTDRVSSTSATPADVSGFSATITPSLTSSKILVMVTVFFGGSNSSYAYTLCQRQISGGATTSIGLGTGASGSQTNIFVGRRMDVIQDYGESSKNFLDTPNTTSAITYQMQLAKPYGTTVYINRQDNAADSAYISFPSSTITLLEIGA